MIRHAFVPQTPRRKENSSEEDESVEVYCRLRPMLTSERSCLELISPTTIQLTIPESSKIFKKSCITKYEYTFKDVFTEEHTQKDVFDEVAYPLVRQLIYGKNGLLFTYGVTGSGKTYTMTGLKQDVGIMPRCLDLLFNSIGEYKAKKYVFKSDRMNAFDVQSELEAERDRDRASRGRNNMKKGESFDDLLSNRSQEDRVIEITEQDNAFAVFVTFVEIYNNNVYDLLENAPESDIYYKPQLKVIRKDGADNMYVHTVTEVEVTSTAEAFDIFYKGQKRRRMAKTQMNVESSRSHSIFTIRLVQAPLSEDGENVLQNKESICISQLSLVDLAGVERTNRTKNQGDRLQEGGCINNSLMTLRKCLNTLRENQKNNTTCMIPSRESKLTLMFKNFFEGQGNIRMIVCANPRMEDCDENFQVLQFADITQEISVKATPIKTISSAAIGLTPGRRRENQNLKRKLHIIEEAKENCPVVAYIPDDVKLVYSLEPFPTVSDNDSMNAEYNQQLINFLENRIKRKEELRNDLMARVNQFRISLLQQSEDLIKTTHEAQIANAMITNLKSKNNTLEEKLVTYSNQSSALKRKCEEKDEEIIKLRRELGMKEQIIDQRNAEKYRNHQRTKKMVQKTEKLAQENELNKQEKLNTELQLKERNKQLISVKKIINQKDDILPSSHHQLRSKITNRNVELSSDESTTSESLPFRTPMKQRLRQRPAVTSGVIGPKFRTPVSNPRYGNAKCTTHDQWIDHQQTMVTPMSTILQPSIKKKKSFDKITSPKEMRKSNKYCLTTHNQDENGDIETQIFKGDVLPTSPGGAQVVFNDIEILKQQTPYR